jgi:periplasmic protein TonB
VKLRALIDKDGSVAYLSVISGHPLLVPAAMEGVQQWHYEPTLIDGQPIEVLTEVDVS